MSKVTQKDVKNAVFALKIEPESIVLVHSSLKSLGVVDGGAEAVASGFLDALSGGTLVMPTLSSKNWESVFEDWHLDRPSDVGLITETFRRMPEVLRSDNPTHSVAAKGKLAKELTDGPKDKGARYGIFGDYCFSHYSPWQKMYDSREQYGVRAYVVFLGVTMYVNTYKHFIEYRLVERALKAMEGKDKYSAMKAKLWHYPNEGIWPFYDSLKFQDELDKMGLIRRTRCGDAELICADIKEMVDATEKAIAEGLKDMLKEDAFAWITEAFR